MTMGAKKHEKRMLLLLSDTPIRAFTRYYCNLNLSSKVCEELGQATLVTIQRITTKPLNSTF